MRTAGLTCLTTVRDAGFWLPRFLPHLADLLRRGVLERAVIVIDGQPADRATALAVGVPPGVALVDNPRPGRARALNLGLGCVATSHLVVCDVDDRLDAANLGRVREALLADDRLRRAHLVFAPAAEVDDPDAVATPASGPVAFRPFGWSRLLVRNVIAHSGVILRRGPWLRYPPDQRSCVDLAMYLRLRRLGCAAMVGDRTWSIHYRNPGTAFKRMSRGQYASDLRRSILRNATTAVDLALAWMAWARVAIRL